MVFERQILEFAFFFWSNIFDGWTGYKDFYRSVGKVMAFSLTELEFPASNCQQILVYLEKLSFFETLFYDVALLAH